MADRVQNYVLQDIYKDLGPMLLCGVLHVTYQTTETITGEFMVCVLFNRYMLFAKGINDLRRLEAVASVYLDKAKIEVLQNGRGKCYSQLMLKVSYLSGLSCYGCIFSWKLSFQNQNSNYELVLSASSAAEEKQWKTEILKVSAALVETGKPRAWGPGTHSFSALELAPLDQIHYQVSSMARRSYMDSVSVPYKHQVEHVIVKKTHYPRHVEGSIKQAEGEIERPKTPPTVPAATLIARRIVRIRLERLITDVWFRDLLPLPGMVLGRGDIFGRRPLMEKLSIHTGFHKRSASTGVTPRKTSTEVRSEDEAESKGIRRSSGVFDDKEKELECEQPRVPITPQRTRTLRFIGSPKTSSPRSETRSSQDESLESTPSPKKWSSKSLFSALAPRKLKKTRQPNEMEAK